ncbi:hypothetical protein J6590_106847, partial [Homalodisca vitripennis]
GPLKAPLKSTSLHKPKVVTCHDWRLRTADLNDEGGVWKKSIELLAAYKVLVEVFAKSALDLVPEGTLKFILSSKSGQSNSPLTSLYKKSKS